MLSVSCGAMLYTISVSNMILMHALMCVMGILTCKYYIFLSPLAMHSHSQSSKKHRSYKFLFPCLPNFPIPEFHPSPRPLGACCALQVHPSGQGAGRGAGRPGGTLGVASGGGGPRGASRGTGGGSVSETVGSGRPWRQSSTSSRPLLPLFYFSFLSSIRVATTAQVLAVSICLAWGEPGEPHL